MKLVAIAGRGTRRDFVDLYFLITKFGLGSLVTCVDEKYPHYELYHVFMALTYFADAEEWEKGRYELLKSAPDWEKMKTFFVRQAEIFEQKYL